MEALQSALQPLTQNLPQPIADIGISLLGPTCYQTLIYNVDLSATECVKLAISKGLGIGIVGASAIVKVPQLLKLLNSQSAEGLSFLAYLLESGAYLIGLAYNVRRGFPFSTYGETALILVQNIAIASLVLKYSGKGLAVAGWVGGLLAAGAALFNDQLVNEERLAVLQAGAGVLGVASKVPQILTVWSQGGTGQLSAFAVSIHFSFAPFLALPCTSEEHLLIIVWRRSSITSLAPSLASSPPSRKSTIPSSCTASLRVSPSTPSSSARSCTTGTRPPPRKQSPGNLKNLSQLVAPTRKLCDPCLAGGRRERALARDAGGNDIYPNKIYCF